MNFSTTTAPSIRDLVPIYVEEPPQPEPVRKTVNRTVAQPPRAAQEKNESNEIAPLEVSLSLEGESNLYRGFDTLGIFVATWQVLEKGTEVAVTFGSDDGSVGHALGIVRWVRDYNPASPDTTPGMAVELVYLPEQARGVFDRFAKRREPLFYD